MRNNSNSGRRGLAGFTLVELMITVAVVGILAAIAYPSFNEQMRKARRSDAVTALMEVANREEIFFSNFNTYTTDLTPSADPCAGATCGINYVSSSPEGHYDLTIAAGGSGIGTSFTASAAPVASGPQSGDKCGTFTLTDTGLQGITGGATGVTAAQCW